MGATSTQIADAVVAAMSGASLSQQFTAERFYKPVFDLQGSDLAGLRVSVVPTTIAFTPLHRRADDFTYAVSIGIQKRLDLPEYTNGALKAACDPLAFLAEEIIDLFRGNDLAGVEGVTNTGGDVVYPFDPERLDSVRVFEAVITLTFKKARARS